MDMEKCRSAAATVNSDKDLFREETKHCNHYFMSSFLIKDEPMRKEDYSQKVLDLFLPVNKLTKTKEGYRWMGQYKNLSRYEFSKEEIEFLSDCYFSGKHSLIGVTNADGLTIQAISDRYQISKDLVESWMWSSKEQRMLIKEMMDCVNGKITSEQTIQRNSHDICTNPIDISLISETIDTSLISETIDTRLSSEALDTSLISATIDNSLISDIIDSSLISERSDDYYEVDRLFRQQQQPTGDSIGPLEGYFKIMLLHQPKDN